MDGCDSTSRAIRGGRHMENIVFKLLDQKFISNAD